MTKDEMYLWAREDGCSYHEEEFDNNRTLGCLVLSDKRMGVGWMSDSEVEAHAARRHLRSEWQKQYRFSRISSVSRENLEKIVTIQEKQLNACEAKWNAIQAALDGPNQHELRQIIQAILDEQPES